MEPYRYFPGSMPVIVSIPHTGTYVPPGIVKRFTSPAKPLPDTDWHVEKLYNFARALGVHMLVATHSRYVVDLNRAPDNASLYPGQFTTGLCPLTLFDGSALYESGQEPDEKETAERIAGYWQPYHQKLQSLIHTLKQEHGKVALFDAHSICSQVPALFEGTLPDLNIGTDGGRTADAALTAQLVEYAKASRYSLAYNGRFKGGYITRHYGSPTQGIHAIQLELAQHNYMNEMPPYAYDDAKAVQLQTILRGLLERIVAWTVVIPAKAGIQAYPNEKH